MSYEANPPNPRQVQEAFVAYVNAMLEGAEVGVYGAVERTQTFAADVYEATHYFGSYRLRNAMPPRWNFSGHKVSASLQELVQLDTAFAAAHMSASAPEGLWQLDVTELTALSQKIPAGERSADPVQEDLALAGSLIIASTLALGRQGRTEFAAQLPPARQVYSILSQPDFRRHVPSESTTALVAETALPGMNSTLSLVARAVAGPEHDAERRVSAHYTERAEAEGGMVAKSLAVTAVEGLGLSVKATEAFFPEVRLTGSGTVCLNNPEAMPSWAEADTILAVQPAPDLQGMLAVLKAHCR